MFSKTQTQTSWLEQIKSTFDLERFTKSLDLSFHGVMNLLIYLCGGFFVGFFFKKSMRYLFLSILITLILLYVLNMFQIITIDIIKLKTMLGMNPTDSFQDLGSIFFEWIKNNMPIVLSACIGFVIGYKVA